MTGVQTCALPICSTLLYEKDLGSSNLKSWKEAGHTVGTIETFVYVDVD